MLPNAVLNGAAKLESLPVMALVLPLILESALAKGSPSRVMASRMVLLNRPLAMASPICPALVLMPVVAAVSPVYRPLFSHSKAMLAMPGVSFARDEF